MRTKMLSCIYVFSSPSVLPAAVLESKPCSSAQLSPYFYTRCQMIVDQCGIGSWRWKQHTGNSWIFGWEPETAPLVAPMGRDFRCQLGEDGLACVVSVPILERILARMICGPACLQRVFDEDKFLRRPERPWSRPASRASAPLLLFRRCTPTVGPTGLQATMKSRPETAREDLRALNGCRERRIRCWMIQVRGERPLGQNGTSGAGETSGSVLRTRTWVVSQAVRPASIPSLSATCATVPILLQSKSQ